ncbi:hypothetical protein SPSIL_028350 [Sporomusa silvacetica DSM 10669]|uniref:Uncharacterized protein n=1 Tax=Sporomusa silvacetica DSM 10669 TaxID=1123289 RepID=A0ABZ3IM53_9FIRM|nr:hypothetical protein [Sporomusa silvacetica]OZC21864.1 hypothetical protein SPSIL_07900 [Sporomusa silvacetica DSM 10669]
MDRIIDNYKIKGFIYLFIVFLVMVSSTAAWLYFSSDIPKKTPMRAKQVFLWHNNQNNAQTSIAN